MAHPNRIVIKFFGKEVIFEVGLKEQGDAFRKHVLLAFQIYENANAKLIAPDGAEVAWGMVGDKGTARDAGSYTLVQLVKFS